MKFEWDPKKNRSNVRKHGVNFADTTSVFFDDAALTIEDDCEYGEQRFVSIGMDSFARLLVVVYSMRENNIRIISARKATKNESKAYGELR